MIPPPIVIQPSQADFVQRLDELPESAGIYLLSIPSNSPHISWSQNLRRRLRRLFSASFTATRPRFQELREKIARVECWPTGSKLESAVMLYKLVKSHYPDDYMSRLRLRKPWFVKIVDDPFPRLAVLNRTGKWSENFYGPFRTRDSALQYEESVSGLFQIRRCTERLQPSPEHPGCIYGEMNQCLRPCQCAVTRDEYRSEVHRVADFLSNNGRSMMTALSIARDRACEETNFEHAALLHKRIEKVKMAAKLRDNVVTKISEFNGLALTRGNKSKQLQLWPVIACCWQEPVILDFAAGQSSSQSLDRELRERLTAALEHLRLECNRTEELALFARWYFSSWRDGLWFPFHTLGDLNYRTLVREISKMAGPPN